MRQLVTGAAPASQQAALVAHLDGCSICQRKLDELAGANAVLLQAASDQRLTVFAREAPLRKALGELENDPRITSAYQTPGASARSLLRPARSREALAGLAGYEVKELLGQGGMALVFKAFETSLQRWVAIKVLAPELAGDPVARQRFAREARAAAAVRHESVITIHAVGEIDGLPYLIMEYAAGGSLQRHLDDRRPLDWQTIARLGAEIASGLAAAHAQGLVHRDIKPSNVLLQGAMSDHQIGTAKIADFGLAHIADDMRLTQTGVIAGTPMYMAPEQARREPLDFRADLFSLGSVLYVLCTGVEPFHAESSIGVMHQVCETAATPIRELNPAIAPWLAAIVDRLHAKNPGERFSSAAEVAELLRYNREHPTRPRALPPLHRAAPTRRRRLALAAALLLLAAWGALSAVFHWPPLFGPPAHESLSDRITLKATLRGHRGPVMSVAFAPDGNTVATASDDTTVRLWDAATGKEKNQLSGHASAAVAVAFAHSGEFLVSGDSDGTVRLWDAVSGEEQPALPHRGGSARRLAVSPDDQSVAVASAAQSVELWDLSTRMVRKTLAGQYGSILALAFSPDGGTLATGDAGGQIRFWDPASGAQRDSVHGDSLSLRLLAFAPDGKTLASAGTGDRDVKLWSVESHDQVGTLSGFESDVSSLAFSPDSRLLATGSRDGSVMLWRLPDAEIEATVSAHHGNVWAMAFSPEGRTLATVGADGLGKLFDVESLSQSTRD